MKKKTFTLKDLDLLTARARRELQVNLIPKETAHQKSLADYIPELTAQIHYAEEFIFQARRYLKKAIKK